MFIGHLRCPEIRNIKLNLLKFSGWKFRGHVLLSCYCDVLSKMQLNLKFDSKHNTKNSLAAARALELLRPRRRRILKVKLTHRESTQS